MKTQRRKKNTSANALVISEGVKHPEKTWEQLKKHIIEMTAGLVIPVTDEELNVEKNTFEAVRRRTTQMQAPPKVGHCTFIRENWKAGMTRDEMLSLLKKHGYNTEAGGVKRVISEQVQIDKAFERHGWRPLNK